MGYLGSTVFVILNESSKGPLLFLRQDRVVLTQRLRASYLVPGLNLYPRDRNMSHDVPPEGSQDRALSWKKKEHLPCLTAGP